MHTLVLDHNITRSFHRTYYDWNHKEALCLCRMYRAHWDLHHHSWIDKKQKQILADQPTLRHFWHVWPRSLTLWLAYLEKTGKKQQFLVAHDLHLITIWLMSVLGIETINILNFQQQSSPTALWAISYLHHSIHPKQKVKGPEKNSMD